MDYSAYEFAVNSSICANKHKQYMQNKEKRKRKPSLVFLLALIYYIVQIFAIYIYFTHNLKAIARIKRNLLYYCFEISSVAMHVYEYGWICANKTHSFDFQPVVVVVNFSSKVNIYTPWPSLINEHLETSCRYLCVWVYSWEIFLYYMTYFTYFLLFMLHFIFCWKRSMLCNVVASFYEIHFSNVSWESNLAIDSVIFI